MPKSVRRRRKRTTKRKSSYKVRHRNVRRVKKQTKKKFKGGHPPGIVHDCKKLLMLESKFIQKYDDFLTFIDKFRGFESIEDITNILPKDPNPEDPNNMGKILLNIIYKNKNKKPVEIIALFTAKFHQDLLDEFKLNIENNKHCDYDTHFLKIHEILNCIQPETNKKINKFITDIKKFKKKVIDYIKKEDYTKEGFDKLIADRDILLNNYAIIKNNYGQRCNGLISWQKIMDYIRIACTNGEITLDTGECIYSRDTILYNTHKITPHTVIENNTTEDEPHIQYDFSSPSTSPSDSSETTYV